MIDQQTQLKLRTKFNPDGSALRKAQLRMAEMLEFLDRVCSDNQIVYWIDSGTLLGAVRHGGFIPWDEDVDICMPWEDYKKFLEIMTYNKISNEFVIQNGSTDSGYFGFWSTLRDLKSEYIQNDNIHNRREYRGLQIDIFPVSTKINPTLLKISRSIRYRIIDKRIKHDINANVTFPFKLLKNIIFPIFRGFSNLKPLSYYQMTYGCSFLTKRYVKNIYPLKRISFEGIMLNAPCNHDAYLQDIYGEWEKIPSLDRIQTHDVKFKFKA